MYLIQLKNLSAKRIYSLMQYVYSTLLKINKEQISQKTKHYSFTDVSNH